MTKEQANLVVACVGILTILAVVAALLSFALTFAGPAVENKTVELRDGRKVECLYTAASMAALECDFAGAK